MCMHIIMWNWQRCLCLTSNLTGVTNQFVDLSFDPGSKFVPCFFLTANEMTWSIVYGFPGETCTMFSHQSYSSRSSCDKVYFGFPEANHLQSWEEYCFVATANNGTFTVLVEGSMLTTATILWCRDFVHMWCFLKMVLPLVHWVRHSRMHTSIGGGGGEFRT